MISADCCNATPRGVSALWMGYTVSSCGYVIADLVRSHERNLLVTPRFFLAAAVATLALSPLARAADTTPNDRSVVMTALDPDNDGTVSLDEARKAAEAKFNALDTDHDGTLDVSELTGIMSAKQVKATDKDSDDTLDKAEYLRIIEAKFKKIDKDHDGTLDRAELSSEEGRELVAMLAY